MLGFGFQSCYAILNRQMAERLGLTATDIGIVGSTYTWCFAVTQLVSGALLDRVGARRVLPKACALLTAGIFCFAWAGGLAGLVAAQVLVASGAAFGFVGAGFVSRMWFSPRQYGVLFSLAQFAVSFAAFACQQSLARGLEGLPYEWVISVLGIVGLSLFTAMLLWLRDPPCVARIVLVGAASFGAMLSLSGVWGTRLLIAHGLPPVEAGSAVSLGWLGLAVAAPFLVWFGHKYDKEKLLIMLGLALQALCVSLLLVLDLDEPWLPNLLMFLWGAGTGANLLPFVLAARCAGEGHTGAAMALVNCGQFIVGGLLVYIPGRLLDAGLGVDINGALVILPLSLLATLAVCFKLKV